MAVARSLGSFVDSVVFVGGASVGLLITDPAAPAIRPTKDVDLILKVASCADYQTRVREELLSRGFTECNDPDAPICAWKIDGCRVDVMPTESSVLGFANSWYKDAMKFPIEIDLEGCKLRVISAPYFLATKLEAFDNRGSGDFYGSHDIEDVVAIIDGRPTLCAEVAAADNKVRQFLTAYMSDLGTNLEFKNALPGHLERGREGIVMN